VDHRARKWGAVACGVLVAVIVLIGLAFSFVYLNSESILRRRYDVALQPIAVPTDAASIAEGRRLATIRGCNDGCHGKGVSGGEFLDEPFVARLVAPDLTRIAATHSDSELERVIRHGVRKNGRTTWVMPSSMFHHLTDADLGRIIAFLRSLLPGSGPDTETSFGPLARFEILRHPEYAQALEIEQDAPWLTAADATGAHAAGHYLAITVCSECHGMDLRGSSDGSTPNLTVVGSYSPEAFARLMRTGIAVGERKLGLMSDVAEERFAHLNDDEVRALYAYLSARASNPSPEN